MVRREEEESEFSAGSGVSLVRRPSSRKTHGQPNGECDDGSFGQSATAFVIWSVPPSDNIFMWWTSRNGTPSQVKNGARLPHASQNPFAIANTQALTRGSRTKASWVISILAGRAISLISIHLAITLGLFKSLKIEKTLHNGLRFESDFYALFYRFRDARTDLGKTNGDRIDAYLKKHTRSERNCTKPK